MKDLHEENIPSVSLFISGRPLIVNKEINLSDSFVQLWLPGTAIEGVTDVIFTDANNEINYDFKGKLSYSWPKYSYQTKLNYGDKDYDPLFPYGFGLTYSDDTYMNSIDATETIPQKDEITLFLGSAYPSYKEVISYYDSDKNEQVYEGISADIYKNERAGLSISKFDYKKQDDAKRIDFGQLNTFKTWEISSGSNEDLSYMQDGSLELILRSQNLSDKTLELVIECSKNQEQINMSGTKECYQSFNLSNILKKELTGAWQKITMPLSCLNNKNFEISSITSRAKLTTSGDWVLDIHSIKYLNNKKAETCKLLSEDYE